MIIALSLIFSHTKDRDFKFKSQNLVSDHSDKTLEMEIKTHHLTKIYRNQIPKSISLNNKDKMLMDFLLMSSRQQKVSSYSTSKVQ